MQNKKIPPIRAFNVRQFMFVHIYLSSDERWACANLGSYDLLLSLSHFFNIIEHNRAKKKPVFSLHNNFRFIFVRQNILDTVATTLTMNIWRFFQLLLGRAQKSTNRFKIDNDIFFHTYRTWACVLRRKKNAKTKSCNQLRGRQNWLTFRFIDGYWITRAFVHIFLFPNFFILQFINRFWLCHADKKKKEFAFFVDIFSSVKWLKFMDLDTYVSRCVSFLLSAKKYGMHKLFRVVFFFSNIFLN